MPPVPERPTSWQTFLQAHWGAIAGADFFTTEVWTWRGLVTYYTVFVIDLASRRVQIVGSTPHPDELFMQQVVRTLTAADDGLLAEHHVLICDRDTKWSAPVRARLGEAGIRVVQTPYRGAQCQCLRGAVRALDQGRVPPSCDPVRRRPSPPDDHEYVEHYHRERNHQGIGNELIEGAPPAGTRRSDSSASAARRAAQLLRSRGMMTREDGFDGSADERDTTRSSSDATRGENHVACLGSQTMGPS